VAHGVLIAHLKFQNEPEYQKWLEHSFRKVVCEVSDKEFDDLKSEPGHVIVTESSLNGMEIALVFCPRENWPKKFKFFSLLNI
jgi:hypothetical protein